MKIILVRHATRKKTEGEEDKYLPLESHGETEAVELGTALFARTIKPAVYFTSWFAHAKQTADILQKTINDKQKAANDSNLKSKVVELCTLTPQFPGSADWAGPYKWAGIQILEWIRSEAQKTGNDLRQLDAAVFVMHAPRIQQLLTGMTSGNEPQHRFNFSEGICLTAESFDAFLEGKGQRDGPLLLLAQKI